MTLMLRACIIKKENFGMNGKTYIYVHTLCVLAEPKNLKSSEGVIISKLEARIFPNIDGGA